jgi:hypothetical protein
MFLINGFYKRRYEEKSFSETRMKLNELQLNEPFLRSNTILNEFLTGNLMQDKVLLKKFDLFCIMHYNHLKSLCDYYGYNVRAKFTDQYNFRANTSCYIEWWEDNRAKNKERYGNTFVEFIDDYSQKKKAIK